MVRSDWLNLNGLWDYQITDEDAVQPGAYSGKILVPFAIETALSGVKKPLLPENMLWYRRSLLIPENWVDRRILLHFEAVDWQCQCYLNGEKIGDHTGGYIPFSFDITDYLVHGPNELVVSVKDPSDTHWQQKGKQVLDPHMIYYTATSGIWQTVWLEAVAKQNHIENLKLDSDLDKGQLSIALDCIQTGNVRVTALNEEKIVAQANGLSEQVLTLRIPDPHPWSPDDPFLYDLQIELIEDDQTIDSINSYFAFRKITTAAGRSGKQRIFLNDQAIFLHGPLDQGYWPESGMTPPSEEAIIFDLQETRQLGFNMTRKHIKVEPRRWYYHADRIGLVVIQDMINGGKSMANSFETLTAMLFNRHKDDKSVRSRSKAWRQEQESRTDFERELLEMLNHLHNVPSILIWVPFNESWGQFDAERIGAWVKDHDPGRLVDDASGWYDQGSGDFNSRHTYMVKLKKPSKKDPRVYFISEYGGYNCQIQEHLWDTTSKFGYKMLDGPDALNKAYRNLILTQLIPLIKEGLGGAVYTQLSDVEIESNGFFTYDRKLLKFDAGSIRELNEAIYKTFAEQE
jgi:beta-galactosidase/beta-glucuronidase